MSRVGKSKLKLPSTVDVKENGSKIMISNKANKALNTEYDLPKGFKLDMTDGYASIQPDSIDTVNIPLWGTTVRNVFSRIQGIDKPFECGVELKGVGYKASVAGKKLTLTLGYSHDIIHDLPQDVDVIVEKQTRLVFKSPFKDKLGAEISKIVKYRKPEPYKGKGVIKDGAVIIRKEGKKK